MSIVVDNEQLNNNEEEFSELEEMDVEESVEEPETPEEEAPAVEVPDKFKDKSLEEVVQSYQELEKEFGRKNNELGEQRKLIDQMLELQLKTGEEDKPVSNKEVDFDSLMEDPSTAINDVLDSNPRIKALEEEMNKSRREAQEKVFAEKHPDYMDILNSNEFIEWIQESPIRTKMLQEANANYDVAAADELFTHYKSIRGVQVEAAKEESKAKRDKALKDATVEKGSAETKRKKIFRRVDLIKLRLTDPDKYAAMEPEIIRAYQEKRVR